MIAIIKVSKFEPKATSFPNLIPRILNANKPDKDDHKKKNIEIKNDSKMYIF